MERINLFLSAALVVTATQLGHAQQQSRNLKGQIVNEQKQPVAGATVMLYGNYDNATGTDANGFFNLNVPVNEVTYLRVRLKEKVNVVKITPKDKTVTITWDKATAAASSANIEEIEKKAKL